MPTGDTDLNVLAVTLASTVGRLNEVIQEMRTIYLPREVYEHRHQVLIVRSQEFAIRLDDVDARLDAQAHEEFTYRRQVDKDARERDKQLSDQERTIRQARFNVLVAPLIVGVLLAFLVAWLKVVGH